MLRKKTSAIRYNKNYNHNFEFMGWGVVGSGGGVTLLPSRHLRSSVRVRKEIYSNLQYLQLSERYWNGMPLYDDACQNAGMGPWTLIKEDFQEF